VLILILNKTPTTAVALLTRRTKDAATAASTTSACISADRAAPASTHAGVVRRMLKMKPNFQGGSSYLSFTRLVPGAVDVGVIG